MTATMTHASKSTLQKVKDKAPSAETLIKVGAVGVFGGMMVLEYSLAVMFFVYAASWVDILFGVFFLAAGLLFTGFLLETLTSW